MRVLHLGRFWHGKSGGIERHAALLCKGLAASGVDVVNLVAAKNVHSQDFMVNGVRTIEVASFGVALSTAIAPLLPFKALQLHREKPFDIVHLHLPDPLSHAAALLLPKSVKRVITWHSDIIRQKTALQMYAPFLNRLVNSADAVVAATQAHFDSSTQISPSLPLNRRHVIAYGLDYSALRLTERTTALRDDLRAQAQGRGMVFALGRHVYYKGFDVLINALEHTSAFLILGGDGPLRPQLQQQVSALGLQDRVHFAGLIPEADLAAYFRTCDVFCLPSVEQSEAFGLVQLEAMACAKPVVNTQLNNGVNVVMLDGVTGLTVPVGDAPAMATAIHRLMVDTNLRKQLGGQAQERAYAEFSLAASVQKHVALYEGLLAKAQKAATANVNKQI